MSPDDIRAAIRDVQRESHDAKPIPGTPVYIQAKVAAYLVTLDAAADDLTALPDGELTTAYERFRDDRLVLAWVHDEALLRRPPDFPSERVIPRPDDAA